MSFILSTLFRVLAKSSRIRKWYHDQLHRHTFGASLTPGKIWHQFWQDFVEIIGFRVTICSVSVGTGVVRVLVAGRVPVKPTRKFIVTLVDMPVSMQAAQRCIESAVRHGEARNLEIVPAVDKLHSETFFKENNLSWNSGYCSVTDTFAGMGCFASHYKLWCHCVEIGEPIVVLEHDAEFVAPIPVLRFKGIILLAESHKSWYPLLSSKTPESYYPDERLYGTHAYAITPDAAQKLITQAHRHILPPVDCFMEKRFIEIILCTPAPLKLVQDFSSIATWNKRLI